MKTRLLMIILLFSASTVWARKPGELGLGLVVGDPTGLTVKYWMNSINAFDVSLGFEGDFSLHGDYLWHGWKAFPQPSSGRLAALVGVGAGVRDSGDDTHLGIRVPIGANYLLEPHPIELFVELVPVMELTPDFKGNVDGGIGVRFYFMGFN